MAFEYINHSEDLAMTVDETVDHDHYHANAVITELTLHIIEIFVYPLNALQIKDNQG